MIAARSRITSGGRLGWPHFIFLILILIFDGCSNQDSSIGASNASNSSAAVRINVDPVGQNRKIVADLCEEFQRTSGISVELVDGPVDASERLVQYLQYMGAGSSDIDVYIVDVIWIGLLQDHLLDLKPYFGDSAHEFIPALVANDTVHGRLIAIPWFMDVGMLYCRSDLLKKYGHAAAPATWDELEQAATKIQAGERATSSTSDFWGFVWQGVAREGLVCNGLEWQVSSGGGHIIEPDGRVSINNPEAAAAFDRAASWVGKISPPETTSWGEEEGRKYFQSGRAAFMRNWTYAQAMLNAPDSPVAGNVQISAVPAGAKTRATCLGGWQLAVSAYSTHVPEAAKLVKFLASPEGQRKRAIEGGFPPTRTSLYDDTTVIAALPLGPAMKQIVDSATARPSTLCGAHYNEVASIYSQKVHGVLAGKATGKKAVEEMEQQIRDVLR